MHLAAVITAINELYQRREDVRPEAVREEIIRLDEAKLAFNPDLLVAFADGFRAHDDEENAETLTRAYGWWERMGNHRDARLN